MTEHGRVTKVLFADNKSQVRTERGRWLTEEGWSVTEAASPQEVRAFLDRREDFDLAILDVRLVNDKDERDESGFVVARDFLDHRIPVLVLTAVPDYQYVRRAEEWPPRGTCKRINFLGKAEGGPHQVRETFLRVARDAMRRQKVFVVHGHDHAALDAVQLCLEQLKLEPVVLRDRLLPGESLLAQLEDHADVAYAVVLSTPDDVAGEGRRGRTLRPRQNVVFELGYFVGRLGRSRVAVLRAEGVELPSDYGGIAYIDLVSGNGAWKQQLATALRRSGLTIGDV